MFFMDETIETYCFKCPYCLEFQEPEGFREDVYEEVIECEHCEKTFVGSSYTSTTYTAETVKRALENR